MPWQTGTRTGAGWPRLASALLPAGTRMHLLFVHKSFPGQFGQLAQRLVDRHGCRATFVSRNVTAGRSGGVRRLAYEPVGGDPSDTHPLARPFATQVAHAQGVLRACRRAVAHGELEAPDLIVAHSGFGSSALLPELWPRTPIVNLFEWYYHPDHEARPEQWPLSTPERLQLRTRNAMTLLDLQVAAAGYSPTAYQRSRFPAEYRDRIEVIHDGVDLDLWRPIDGLPRAVGNLRLEPHEKLVTYVARGFESLRGFDVLLPFAQRLVEVRDDVRVLIVGSDRVAYGADRRLTGSDSFAEWVLAQGEYDPSRIHVAERLPPDGLAVLFNVSDLHVYLTRPFVLSWSLVDAMACGATILASDTAPVREAVTDGHDGLLAPLDADALAERALEVLDDPSRSARLGANARRTAADRFSLDVTTLRFIDLFSRVLDVDATAFSPAV